MLLENNCIKNITLILGLLIYPLSALPSLALPSQLIAQPVQQTDISQVVQFIGTGEPQIQVLQGIPRSELLVQIFRGGRWLFYSDGKFMFIPSENANVSSDLYPVPGTYKKVGNTFEFQAERRSATGASASVDGVIRVEGNKFFLEVTQVTNAMISRRIARISQTLSPTSQVAVQPPGRIHNIQVPSFFRVSLRGKTEAQTFGPIPATLKILPPPTGDSNPFFVILKTEDDMSNGSLIWSSFAPVQVGRREFYSKIIIKGNQVRLDINPSQEQSRLDVFWTTLSGGKIGEIIDRSPIGVTANQGTMTFSIKGSSISGRVQSEGFSWFNSPSRYEAEFTGELATENGTLTIQNQLQTQQFLDTTKQIQEQAIAFTGTWEVQPFGSLILHQKGQEVSGKYIGRGGGTIQGRVEGNRLDFTWKDATGQGWGFFRAIADGTILSGMLGTGTEKANGQSLIATQTNVLASPMSTSSQDMRSLRDHGYDLTLQGKCQQALNPLETALDLFKREGRNTAVSDSQRVSVLIDVVNIQTRLSYCYFQLQNYDKLLANLSDVIETRKQLNQRDYIAVIDREQANLIQGSLSGYVEIWRQRLNSDLDKIAALEKAQPFLHDLMRLFVNSGNEKEALLVAEKSKARAFADLLETRSSSSTFPSNAVAPTIQQLQQIAKTQNATLVEYATVCETRKASDICSVDKASKLFIWVVQPTGVINFKQVSLEFPNQQNKSLEDLIYNTRTKVLDQLSNNHQENDPRPELKQLYELLIQPISELLPLNPNSRVIFIPHRELFLVPFSALLDTDMKYFIQKYTALISPSIQILDATRQLQQRNAKLTAKDVLIVANPTLTPEIKLQYGLQPLKEWEQAAIDVAKGFNTQGFNTQILIGEKATKAVALKLMSRTRIIHLATHAHFEKEEALDSWIALAPNGADNGLLTAGEIFDLYASPKGSSLHAELIVLAACNTGRGRITGDGVIGLSRSLIAAGIPTVVISLWTVRETPTISLMKEFYQNLSSGKAEALRKAMLATMKEYPDQPGAWAGFTLVGEAE